MKKDKNFNIILCGVGGQGIITLLQVLAEAALLEGYDVRASELHGLSQRGGSVVAHLRFGKKVFSPLIMPGETDLILSLEITEGLRAASLAGETTTFVINKKLIPFQDGPTEEELIRKFKKMKERFQLIDASGICLEKLGKEVLAGTYLLSVAVLNDLIPLKTESILKAMKNKIAPQYLHSNEQAFALGKPSSPLAKEKA